MRFKNLLPILPLVLCGYFMVRSYLVYTIFVLPKLEHFYGEKIPLINDIRETQNFGSTYLLFVGLLFLLALISVIMFVLKKKYSILLFLAVNSLVCIYVTYTMGNLTGAIQQDVTCAVLNSNKYENAEIFNNSVKKCGCAQCVYEQNKLQMNK